VPLFGPDIVLNDPAYIHPSAQLYGKVTVNAHASVWCNVVVRSESHEVVIGPYTNIQDFVMIHVGAATGSIIGSHCSITHRCTIHGCRIGDNCLIGINTTIMDGCEIGDNCIVAGHTFLRENTKIPANSVVMGTPGEVRRTENNYVRNRINAYFYYQNALAYAKGEYRAWDRPDFPAAVAAEIQRLQKELDAISAGG
jgi:carbonic anhydrase/acetyltransferase-like protein (isoleucine patch superfamily)